MDRRVYYAVYVGEYVVTECRYGNVVDPLKPTKITLAPAQRDESLLIEQVESGSMCEPYMNDDKARKLAELVGGRAARLVWERVETVRQEPIEGEDA